MERGLKIPQNDRTKTTNAILVSLMKQLEKDKKSLKLAPDDSLHLEGFALNIFGKADKQDRAGRADLSTAKTFYAASIFFEVLNQFGELQPDIEQKQKYAAWKAADIRKAIKEGRKPVPGPPGGDQDLDTEYDLEPTQTDMDLKPAVDPSPSPKSYDRVDSQHFPQIPPSPPQNTPPSTTTTEDTSKNYTNYQPSPPPNTNTFDNPTADDYHPNNYFQPPPPPTNGMGNSPYNTQEYPQQQQTPFPSTYPNFQSYPSFIETSLPAAQSHHPSYYYQGSDASSYPATSGSQYESIGRNGSGSHAASAPPPPPPAAVPTFQYDSNYQPPPEKIAEAHKAARFAVGALAFDDVSIAVDFLKKSLELLTNPSAGE
jgi:vacuolar protein sorting-associated protein VTA1